MPRQRKTTTAEKPETKPIAKTESKKAARKNCKTTIHVEMAELSVSVTDIQNAIKKEIKKQGLKATELAIYINIAEEAAYYTVDGIGDAEKKIDLKSL